MHIRPPSTWINESTRIQASQNDNTNIILNNYSQTSTPSKQNIMKSRINTMRSKTPLKP